MTKRASLSKYRRKPEALSGEEVTLSEGVVVSIREWGCPQFYAAMQEGGIDETLAKLSQTTEAIDRALSHWVIAYIWDGERKIDDVDEIHQIVTDPLMWQFRLDVIELASEENRFLLNGAVVKNSLSSSRKKRSGGESTQAKMSTGHG